MPKRKNNVVSIAEMIEPTMIRPPEERSDEEDSEISFFPDKETFRQINSQERSLIKKHMELSLSKKDLAKWNCERGSNWADTLEKIPFGYYNTPDITLDSFEMELNKNIVCREKEKEEILRKTATFIHNGRFRRPLLFVGAPGEGKSRFAITLAKALGYPLHYIHVPTLNNALAIWGTEKHYSNSKIGELLQAVIDNETLSVVFVFDEIDKANSDSVDGSVEAALLSLFDPLWNGFLIDRSVGIPVDFSHCIFICTANELSSISPPLLDRLDILEFDNYAEEDVCFILEQFTVPNEISKLDMKGKIKFEPDVVKGIVDCIKGGTMRDYEKAVEKLLDNALYVMIKKKRKTYTVTTEDLYLLEEKVKPALGF